MNCDDVNMCEACEASGVHPLNHLVWKTYYPEKKPEVQAKGVGPLEKCTGCGEENAEYHRFVDFDKNEYFCSSCAPLCEERLWKIRCGVLHNVVVPEERGKNPRGAACDIRFANCMRGCTGINWKCTRCWATDICEACDAVYVESTKNGNSLESIPEARKRRHTAECAVMKIYYATPAYQEWGLNDLHH
jgi:hypothetical protein